MVRTGLDRLLASPTQLQSRRFGLVTNTTGVDTRLRSNIDALSQIRMGTLAALFAPEHGLFALEPDGRTVASAEYDGTGIPIHSLYGEHRTPTPAMLHGLDLLIYDIQDVGARFYTFISTLANVLEAAAREGIECWVHDRPNPIDGRHVEGPLLQEEFRSFVGAGKLPIRHGMTVGELAHFFAEERGLDLDLKVLALEGWGRDDWFDTTGLPWVMPSPNMPTLDTATVYPGTCLIEGTNVSEGRGTTRPFELIGAPWIDARQLADTLNRADLPGVRFRAAYFQPQCSKHAGEFCQGIQLHLFDREAFRPVATGVALLCVLHALYPEPFQWRQYRESYPVDRLAGTDTLRILIDVGTPWREICSSWQEDLHLFCTERSRWLIYPDAATHGTGRH